MGGSPEANNEGPRPFPVRTSSRTAATPGRCYGFWRQVRAEGEADGKGQRRISCQQLAMHRNLKKGRKRNRAEGAGREAKCGIGGAEAGGHFLLWLAGRAA